MKFLPKIAFQVVRRNLMLTTFIKLYNLIQFSIEPKKLSVNLINIVLD